jgi:hypothetical protein
MWGLSGDQGEQKEVSMWHRADKLPEYDLEITIIGGNRRPHIEFFTLKAKTGSVAAFEMAAMP